MKQFYVYILPSRRRGTLYIGVTSDLIGRVWQHKNDVVKAFTQRYRVHDLVYHELADNAEAAIVREKQLKAWRRQWKIELIEKSNTEWRDLWEQVS